MYGWLYTCQHCVTVEVFRGNQWMRIGKITKSISPNQCCTKYTYTLSSKDLNQFIHSTSVDHKSEFSELTFVVFNYA